MGQTVFPPPLRKVRGALKGVVWTHGARSAIPHPALTEYQDLDTIATVWTHVYAKYLDNLRIVKVEPIVCLGTLSQNDNREVFQAQVGQPGCRADRSTGRLTAPCVQ